jgi:hypothetical protein
MVKVWRRPAKSQEGENNSVKKRLSIESKRPRIYLEERKILKIEGKNEVKLVAAGCWTYGPCLRRRSARCPQILIRTRSTSTPPLRLSLSLYYLSFSWGCLLPSRTYIYGSQLRSTKLTDEGSNSPGVVAPQTGELVFWFSFRRTRSRFVAFQMAQAVTHCSWRERWDRRPSFCSAPAYCVVLVS